MIKFKDKDGKVAIIEKDNGEQIIVKEELKKTQGEIEEEKEE